MNSDSLISLLAGSDWLFIAIWIVLLAGASAVCFLERPLESSSKVGTERGHYPKH